MAYVILDATAPQVNKFRQLQDALERSLEVAERINRQLDEMDDTQAEAQYGIPSGAISNFRTNIDNLQTALSATAVRNFVGSLGFDR